MADDVEITIASHPRWLRLVRQVVEECARNAGFSGQDVHNITVAVGEAVGNVMKHSYKGAVDRSFTLVCRSGPEAFEVQIRDEGEPFDLTQMEPRPPDELRVGGRGVFLMRTLMDEIDYSRSGGVNIIRMRKNLKTPVCGAH